MAQVANGKVIATSFSELSMELVDGELQIVSLVAKPETEDDLAYLNDDIERLRSFEFECDEHWLTEEQTMGVVTKPLFLESSFISDKAMTLLAEHGYEFSWIAQQALMLNKGHMFGIKRTEFMRLAKTLKFEKGRWVFQYADFLEDPKPINSYPKSHIDDIWVWRQDDEGEEHWEIHPELLQKAKYGDITEDQESNVMQYISESEAFQKMFGPNMRLVSGFTALHGKHRYALVMPEILIESSTGKFVHDRTGKQTASLHANASPETKMASLWSNRALANICYPRFLDVAKQDSNAALRREWSKASK